MRLAAREMLRRLGAGESIASVGEAAGLCRAEFDAWWRAEAESRVPGQSGKRCVPGGVRAEIQRDAWGIPHIYAGSDTHLFFAFGYGMAQDRLFQLDYLRRKASGTLAEVLGHDGLSLDTIARTVGLSVTATISERRELPARNRRDLLAKLKPQERTS